MVSTNRSALVRERETVTELFKNEEIFNE